MVKQEARIAARPNQRLIQTPSVVYRKPRPRCGLLSRRVFQPPTAKVKVVEPANDAIVDVLASHHPQGERGPIVIENAAR